MKIKLFTITAPLTLSNLLCGMIATVAILTDGDLHLAFWLLVLAAVFDFFSTASTARRCSTSPRSGCSSIRWPTWFRRASAPTTRVLSTLAWPRPAVRGGRPMQGPLGWIVLLLAVGTALRLAKFNIDDTQRTEFCGLPSPAAGLFCASLGLLHAEGMLSLPYEAVLLAAAATAWLMISPIRMFALKFHGFGWTGNRLRYLFLGACVVLILTLGAYAIPAIFVLYVVVSLVRWLLQGRRAAEA